jgi:glycosyltransferase involved in cell wall biosynthesis
LITWKGIFVLLDAFKQYVDRGGKGRLAIYGSGPDRDEISSRIAQLDIPDRCTIHDYSESVMNKMRSCSVVVCPTVGIEPLGRVVMEAMRLGVPVVASNTGGHAEIIVPGVSGLLYEPTNSSALATCLLSLYNDPSARERFSSEGLTTSRQWALSEYSPRILSFLRLARAI